MPAAGVSPDEARKFLVASYGCAAGLLVLYFTWERALCHWSHTLETAYLALVVVLLFLAPILWWELAEDSAVATVKLNYLLRFFILANILRRFVLARVHPRFFDAKTTARNAAKAQLPLPSLRARRMAHEVEVAVDEIQTQVSGRTLTAIFAGALLEPTLYLLLMLQDFATAYGDFGRAILWPLVAIDILLPACGVVGCAVQFLVLRGRRKRLHKLLKSLVKQGEGDALRHVLASVSVGTLLEVVHWKTLELLTQRALDAGLLCPTTKAILIDGLQLKGIRLRGQLQVRALLLSCHGTELTTVKNLVDGSGRYQNLYKLIFQDVPARTVRDELLRHFSDEALKVREKLGRPAGVKVLSDVDDTLYSSGGHFPAGCDKRFPKHAVYPGFLELLRVLDKGRWDPDAPSCNLVFLSARPHIYKDVAEDRSYRLFQGLVAEGRMHSTPTLLPGKLPQGLWAILAYAFISTRAWLPVGMLKHEVYLQFQQLYTEYDFVFCGDNGQGDLWAGQRMLENPSLEPGPSMRCVLIHQVLDSGRALGPRPPLGDEERWIAERRGEGLVFHKSYVGAATALHTLDPGLVSAGELRRVAQAAVEEFDDIKVMYPEWGARWEPAEGDLLRDLGAADALLQRAGLSPLPRSRTACEEEHEQALGRAAKLAGLRVVDGDEYAQV